jgi:hypothetical protein
LLPGLYCFTLLGQTGSKVEEEGEEEGVKISCGCLISIQQFFALSLIMGLLEMLYEETNKKRRA